ncbi:WD40 repeat domain-containing protein [Candidatus Bipolaricaulota bacterium]
MRRMLCLVVPICALALARAVTVSATDVQIISPDNVFQIVKLHSLSGHTGYVRDVTFSPDGTFLASIGDDRSVRLWDVAAGQEAHVFHSPGSAAYINSLSFSPDGNLLASPDGVLDLETLTAIRQFEGDVMSTAFSPDGEILAVGAVLQPVQLLDTTTWDVVSTFESLKHVHPTADDSFGFEFSPDGALLADGTLRAGDVRLWDVETGTLRQTLAISQPGTDVHDVAFSSDGQLIAGGGQGPSVCLFRVEDGGIGRVLPTGEGTMSLDFSPDGRLLAISCEGVLSLWNVETGRRLRSLRHDNAVTPVTFSPDGRFLACGLYGGYVAVWGIRE